MDPRLAEQVVKKAEALRVSLAQTWLGKTLPDRKVPCSIRVKITATEPGGNTSFEFVKDTLVKCEMTVEGRFERILESALPHEVMHTVLTEYFGPLPRWAEEGLCLLAEDRYEHELHDRFARRAIKAGQDLPLYQLFDIEKYPADLQAFYGQSYSLTRFLIEKGGKNRFLHFMLQGPKQGWETAAKRWYWPGGVAEIERRWKPWARKRG